MKFSLTDGPVSISALQWLQSRSSRSDFALNFPAFPLRSRRSRCVPGVLAAFVTLTAACGAAPRSSPTPTPAPSGPRVVLPSGAAYQVEVVRTPEQQAQGLMFRESLPANSGMLFLFPERGVHKFWMKNTMIPLDMIWMDPQGKVLFVSADTPPCKADPCPSFGPDVPALSVLEIAGGMAKKERVTVGATIRFEDVN